MADAVDVLADSFRDYPAMRYFIGPVGRHYEMRLLLLMEFFTSARFLKDRHMRTDEKWSIATLTLTTVACVALTTMTALAQNDDEVEHLSDLREINLFVDDVSADAEAAGLTRQLIEDSVQAQLRERGVPLGRSRQAGDLYVRVSTHRGATGLFAYCVRVSVQQLVTIEGNQRRAFVDTWDLDGLGTVGEGNLPQVERIVLQIVDAFIDDYFEVNDPR